MDRSSVYYRQVQLLISLLPLIAEEDCFALKGGTAINLFVRDMPRLSVDIDLVYLPMDTYRGALANAAKALGRVGAAIRKAFADVAVVEVYRDKPDALRLIVSRNAVQVKIELSPVLRGTVYSPELRSVTESVENEFGFAEMAVVSLADLYAGKFCAALDRQHPRDLFDVRWFLDNDGMTEAIRKAFLVYLISHPRPIAELLAPQFSDLTAVYAGEFANMAAVEMSLSELLETRERLLQILHEGLGPDERAFLLSFKAGHPRWALLGLPDVEHLPAVKWKLKNLSAMSHAKHQAAYKKLEALLRR